MINNGKINIIINICVVMGLFALSLFIFRGYKNGLFTSTKTFQDYILSFGAWSTVVFLGVQMIQVIIPILPSSIGCVVGIIIFGPWIGFLYNYISICSGSIINFALSKRYGYSFVKKIVIKKYFDKYIGWVEEGKKFDKMFTFAIFLPGAPDDFLCYIAGLTKIKFRKFFLIILLGKPLSIAIFSLGVDAVINILLSVLK